MILTTVFFFSCKNSTQEKKPVTIKEFLKLYKPANLPLNVADSGLENFGDTIIIEHATFTQFIPDSALKNVLKDYAESAVIHPAAIIHTKALDYLLTKFTSAKKIKLIVFVFDEKHNYKASLSLLNNKSEDGYNNSLSVTNEPTFILRRDKTATNKENLYSRNGYAYNAATSSFTAVLNDSNEDTTRHNEIINPIDTLAAINKYSGDYITDKQNFISLRDGKSLNAYRFFIHFKKDKTDCIGELKGVMTLVNETNAVYQQSGDPCVINFKLSVSNIKVKEEGNCGNYRGINCPFDFSFKKKKLSKIKMK